MAPFIQLILITLGIIFKSPTILLISGFFQVLIDLLILEEDRGAWVPKIILKIILGILVGFFVQDLLNIGQFPAMMGGYAIVSILIEIVLYVYIIIVSK